MAAFTRTNDGTEFGLDDGLEVLAPFVYDTLRGVAKVFGATITYKELGDEVLQSSGLATNMGLQNWIGRLLAKVVRMAHEENAPPLTALVVRSDSGMVGEGYDEVLTVAGESSIKTKLIVKTTLPMQDSLATNISEQSFRAALNLCWPGIMWSICPASAS